MSNKKVVVAMSGGVDSSLTAALLKERGFEVIGITMRLSEESQCCSLNEANDARQVAEFLNIPHYVVDFQEEFKMRIINYFIDEYLNGRTPNPCVECNKYIKFGKLFDFVDEIGADFLATGHYAQVNCVDDKYLLQKGLDLHKDQSYVLYNLTAKQLARIILPLGDKSKDETRKLAEQLNLPVAHKPDSQEICFIPNDDYKSFILQNVNKKAEALQPGEIVDVNGKILGYHKGTAFYTIGQRKGLGIAASEPLYVVNLDVNNHRVIVGGKNDVFTKTLTANNVHWIYPQTFPLKATAKIRYGARVAECTINPNADDTFNVDFNEMQRAVTPGQSIVFYDDDIVLGGGIIS